MSGSRRPEERRPIWPRHRLRGVETGRKRLREQLGRELDLHVGNDRPHGGAVAIRAARRTIVARSVGRAFLVLPVVSGNDEPHRIRKVVNCPTKLQR